MKTLVVLALLLLPLQGRCDSWAVMSVASYHIQRGGYCEFNLGGGREDDSLIYGVYRNSFCRASYYLGGKYVPLQYGPWKAGLVGIGATGYESTVSLGAGLVLSYEGEKYGGNAIWFPNKEGTLTKGVIGFQLKVRW